MKKSRKQGKKITPKHSRSKDIILLIILIAVLIIINYPFLDKALEKTLITYETGIAERVIDGDTIKIGNESTRFLGINTPEKGQAYYNEAKKFLEDLILNKTISLERGKDDIDKYQRKLRYIFLEGENVNLKLIKGGLANYYFPSGKDKYYNSFKAAWIGCIKENKNLCEKSKDKCGNCINLKEFDYKGQEVIFENTCNFYCDLTGWTIKDEGRKVFTFPKFTLQKDVTIDVGNKTNTKDTLYWKGEDYVWTGTGDTLFLRDKQGKLVLWSGY